MEVILDTNFIISCLMKRIDFLEELESMGFKVKVPREVLQELKDLKRDNKTSREVRAMIDIAFQLFDGKKVKKMKLGGRTVDHGLIERGREGFYIATLDKGIKVKVPNRVVISGAKSGVSVERD